MKPYRETVALTRWSKVCAFRQHHPEGLRYDLHFHPEQELVFIEEGSGEACIAHDVCSFGPGDVIALEAGVPHTFRSQPLGAPFRALIVHYSEEALAGLDAGLCSPARHRKAVGATFHARDCQGMHSHFDYLQRQSEHEGPGEPSSGLRMRAALYSILADVAEREATSIARRSEGHGPSGRTRALLTKVLNFINQNHGRRVTLSEAAELAGLRTESFCRFFKRHVGLTYTQYLNQVRLEHAARELVATDRLILEIGLEAGYQNLSYFNRRFKQRFKVTPQIYRRERQI